MATIVNTPAERTDNGLSVLIGVMMIFFLMIVLFTLGAPLIRSLFSNQTPAISVPERIDVNVNQGSEVVPAE